MFITFVKRACSFIVVFESFVADVREMKVDRRDWVEGGGEREVG